MMTPPLTWLLAYQYEMGALGGWIGICIDIFVMTGVFWVRVMGTRWYAAADRSLDELSGETVIEPVISSEAIR